jgi:hypothetical protein
MAGRALDSRIAFIKLVFIQLIDSVFIIMVAVQAICKIHVVLMGKQGRGLLGCFGSQYIRKIVFAVTAYRHKENAHRQNDRNKYL